MRDIAMMDPMCHAFFGNDTLEIAERTGLALRETARYADISFGKHVMPHANARTKDSCGGFTFAEGFVFDHGKVNALIEKYPDQEALIRKYEWLHNQYVANFGVSNYTPEACQLLEDGAIGWGGSWGGHGNPDYARLIDLGTEGVRALIKKYRSIHTVDADWFYNACEYALDALDILGERFCALAKEMATNCDDEADRQRYLKAAKAFETVPRKPANDFTSACMCFWMVFTFDGIDSPGRFDQYMIRPYRESRDIEEAADVLERLWECFHDTRTWNLCLSGSDANGIDQSNELTYEILKLAARKKYQTPNITLRVHRNTPQSLWEAITDSLSSGIGMPALYNDEVVCPALENIGIFRAHAHEYCLNGCNQIDIMGKSHMGLEDGEVSLGKVLEMTLHNGVSFDGKVTSIPSGDASEFESFDELWAAFDKQLQYAVHNVCQTANNAQHKRAAFMPNPLRSCLIEGCLEKGIDYRNGGPLYGHGQILAETIADCGDSLWALKKLVFDEKKYTMAQVVEALKANYVGYETLQKDFASCEKFGNDMAAVDAMTAKVVNRFLTLCQRHRTYRGGIYTGGCSTFSRAADYGRKLGALSNGRKNGNVIVADSIAATPGCDVKGPTALIKSVLNMDHGLSGSGFVFQMKFDKKIFETPKGRAAFQALAKAHFAGGGQQLTATVVSPEELLDAKVHPENHRNLIVRVGGYSDYFVNLESGLQDNIIARNFQQTV